MSILAEACLLLACYAITGAVAVRLLFPHSLPEPEPDLDGIPSPPPGAAVNAAASLRPLGAAAPLTDGER